MKGSIKQRSKGTWRLRYDGPPEASGSIILTHSNYFVFGRSGLLLLAKIR